MPDHAEVLTHDYVVQVHRSQFRKILEAMDPNTPYGTAGDGRMCPMWYYLKDHLREALGDPEAEIDIKGGYIEIETREDTLYYDVTAWVQRFVELLDVLYGSRYRDDLRRYVPAESVTVGQALTVLDRLEQDLSSTTLARLDQETTIEGAEIREEGEVWEDDEGETDDE